MTRKTTWLAMLLMTLAAAHPTRADLVISAPIISAAAGSTGSFDVIVTDTDPAGSAPYQVAGDDIQLTLSGPAGVTFTGVSIDTSITYLYVDSATNYGVGPLSLDPFPNTSFTASDSEFGGTGYDTISPGQSFGLVHVTYAVDAAAAAGDHPLTLGPNTGLSDDDGNPVSFTVGAGNLNVVPEPSARLLMATGLIWAAARVRACRGRRGR